MTKINEGSMRGRCEYCQETHRPITYYGRTKEYLCYPCIDDREREKEANIKNKQEDEYKEIWDDLVSLPKKPTADEEET